MTLSSHPEEQRNWDFRKLVRSKMWFRLLTAFLASSLIPMLVFALLGVSGDDQVTGSAFSALRIPLLIAVASGEGHSCARILSHDELGELATDWNDLLERKPLELQCMSPRGDHQESLDVLMSELKRLANGDLTVQATVTDTLVGPIAQSINEMIHQLRQIVTNVQGASLQVSQSANQIHTGTEHLSAESAEYAARIGDTTAAVDEMVESIRRVAENTSTSAAVAEEGRETAARGSQAVLNTIRSMERIRTQVDLTSKRIKHLGETSQQIGEIVQLISDVADRTSILALNASIQAAMAGEPPPRWRADDDRRGRGRHARLDLGQVA